jgi:serine protease Do
MKRLAHQNIVLALCVWFCFLSAALSEEGPNVSQFKERSPDRNDFASLAKTVGPVVVNISASQVLEGRMQEIPRPFGEPFPYPGDPLPGRPSPRSHFRQRAQGSGFIVEPDGTIVTNNHVVATAERITVKLQDEREFEGKVIGRDAKTDIAVVKIDATNLPVVPFGDSDQLQVGEWVVALGSPFGLANTITAGIVSAKGRWLGAGPYDSFIQTDASINPGNSGGPLVNLRGEVVGMNTAIFSGSGVNIGIGFAIPINLVKELLPQLKSKGRVTRGWLGVSIQQVTPDLAASLGLSRPGGALVADVIEDSPAAKAGIQVGDVIVEYNGEKINHSSELPILVARTKVGETVPLKVLRNKNDVALSVTVENLKEEEIVAPTSKTGFGLTVQKLTPEIARSLGLENPQGVIITAVNPGSRGGDAGFRRGDVILEIDRKPIHDLADYEKAVAAGKNKNLLFLVRRGDANIFLALTS